MRRFPPIVAIAFPIAFSASASIDRLGDHYCNSDVIALSDFENGETFHDPSLGNGGGYPGNQTRNAAPPGQSPRSYHLHIPSTYSPDAAMPLVAVLHGAAGAGLADSAAQATRDFWADTAQEGGFIVLAIVASGNMGGWIPGSDDAMLAQAVADAESAYNIERHREYLWGFSAGANFGHGIVLDDTAPWSAYAVNAGALQAYAGASAPMSAADHVPVLLRVGSGDAFYVPQMQADFMRFQAAGWAPDRLALQTFSGGHVITLDDPQAAWQFVCRFARVSP